MNGKKKCKILKQIRQAIADENDIAYVTSECKHQGDCAGTCPKCEAEVRYLEQELAKRQRAGKAVAVAGIAATLMVTASGCDLFPIQTGGDPLPPGYNQELDGALLPPETTAGLLVLPEETDPTGLEIGGKPTELDVPGGLPPITEPTEEPLMGEPVYSEE